VRIQSWEEYLTGGSGAALALTIGVFDGLHLGHQALLARVLARRPACEAAVVTFRENPKQTLRGAAFEGELVVLERKLSLLEEAGVDLVVLIDFSGDFSRMPGRFFLSLLALHGSLRYLAIGSDFHCGRARDTDAKGLAGYFASSGPGAPEVEIMEPLAFDGGIVSSTRIRRAVQSGRLDEAGALLGRPFEVELGGEIEGRGNLRCFGKRAGTVLPPPGEWPARALCGGRMYEGSLGLAGDCLELRGFEGAQDLRRIALGPFETVAKRVKR